MSSDSKNVGIKILGVFAALYLFLVGIKGMSSAIKNMGSDVAESIFTTTSDPLVALFIGNDIISEIIAYQNEIEDEMEAAKEAEEKKHTQHLHERDFCHPYPGPCYIVDLVV